MGGLKEKENMKKEITWADVSAFLVAELQDEKQTVRFMVQDDEYERKKMELKDKQIEALRRENEMLRKRAEANE